jgi:hypothetical protein
MYREPPFVLRRRRPKALSVARVFVQLERAVAKPAPKRTNRVSLRNA